MPDPYDSTLTEEQRKYIREQYPDVAGRQQSIARQMLLADKLRTPSTCDRPGWANQAACAIQGIHGGYQEGLRNREHRELRDELSRFWKNAPGGAPTPGPSALPFMGGNDEYGERPGFIAQQQGMRLPPGVTPFGYPRRPEDELPSGGGYY